MKLCINRRKKVLIQGNFTMHWCKHEVRSFRRPMNLTYWLQMLSASIFNTCTGGKWGFRRFIRTLGLIQKWARNGS